MTVVSNVVRHCSIPDTIGIRGHDELAARTQFGEALGPREDVSHMPEISRFFGIVVQMYYSDHEPPHFHVRYSGQKALIAIETLAC